MASYSQFFPEVIPYCPDVADPVAETAIRNACIEFCERTRFLQEDLDPIPMVANEGVYEIDTDAGVKFVDIVEAYYNETLLIPKSSEELSNIYRYTDWRTVKADPFYLTRLTPTAVQLVPRPTFRTGRLRIRAALAPTRASTTVGDAVYEEYAEVIAMGARARLYNTPGQPYFDKKSAMEFDKRFRVAISEARIRVNRGLTRAAGKLEFQRFL